MRCRRYDDDADIGTEVEYVLKTINSQFIEAWGEKVNINLPLSKILFLIRPDQIKSN